MKKIYNNCFNEGGVYQIRNNINNKVYIGSTKCFTQRANQHEKKLIKNKHINKHLQAAWNKDGPAAFVFELLEIVNNTTEEIRKIEQKYIDSYSTNWNQCYNLSRKVVVDNGPWSHDPEKVKLIISAHATKLWQSPEHREKMKKAMEPYSDVQKELLLKHREIQIEKLKKTYEEYCTFGPELTYEQLEKLKTLRLKYYGKIIDPNGNMHDVCSVSWFCKKHNIGNVANFHKLIEGKLPSYNGWRKYSKKLEGIVYVSNKDHKKKSFSLLSPDGKIYNGINITKFCNEHNLRKENIIAVLNGRRRSHKGWRDANNLEHNREKSDFE